MTKIWTAQWLADEPFRGTSKRNPQCKELDPRLPEPHDDDCRHHHWLVRGAVEVRGKDLQAGPVFMDITADDYYKLYVNGRFVAQGPAQSDASHYYYNRLEVGQYLCPGVNLIAVHVYYQGLLNRAWNSGDYRQGLIVEMTAGGQMIGGSNALWKARRGADNRPGEVIGLNTQFTERIDARKADRGWREPDFDDSLWSYAEVAEQTDYTFVEQPTPVLSVYDRLPESVVRLGPGHYRLDFGEEITGQFAMKARGRAGDTIRIRCGEELEDDGRHVRYKLRCNCLYEDEWTLSGCEDELELYDYKGFRYVEIIGPEGAPIEDSFRASVRHYPFDDSSCRFVCSDESVNRIFQICKNGVKYGSQENYVDCPTREKGQYLGDNTVIGHAHMLLTGDSRLYRKAIAQFARSSVICPGLMAVTPGHHMQEIADFSLQWPMQLLEYYRYSGDLDFVREMHLYAEQLLAYFRRYNRGDGLLHGIGDKWNLVDWPESMRDGYDFELGKPVGEGCHNVVNAFYLGCVRSVNELRNLLGIPYEDMLPELAARFNEVFYDPASRLYRDAETSRHSTLHSNVLPLLFGVAPVEATSSIIGFIRGKGLSCSVYFAYFVLKALAACGEHRLICELLTSDGERSWTNMVREGATACFEAWGKEQKWNTSLCHPWASAPVPVLIEDIIGLKPGQPGWREFTFDPHIPEEWRTAKLHIRVPTGHIHVLYEDRRWSVHFAAAE